MMRDLTMTPSWSREHPYQFGWLLLSILTVWRAFRWKILTHSTPPHRHLFWLRGRKIFSGLVRLTPCGVSAHLTL